MYVKPPRRQIQAGMFVPDNYHGTAFTEQEAKEYTEEKQAEQPQAEHTAAVTDAAATSKEAGGPFMGLFSGLGSLRSDDILLLALIVLLARSDEGGKGVAEILPLLAILLFMG